MIATVHVAGEIQLGGLRQECSRCGHVLEDWTGRHAMAVTEPGQPAPTLPLWPVGKRIGVADNATFVMGDGVQLDPETDRECRPTS